MLQYLHKIRTLVKSFDYFQIEYIPREQNAIADLLSKLTNTKKPRNNQSIIQEALDLPTIDLPNIQTTEAAPEFWGTSIIRFLQNEMLSTNVEETKRLRRSACYFALLKNQLYRRGYSMPLLKCVSPDQSIYIMIEIHEGVCRGHLGGQFLAAKILRALLANNEERLFGLCETL